jgi:hypothetical protein
MQKGRFKRLLGKIIGRFKNGRLQVFEEKISQKNGHQFN